MKKGEFVTETFNGVNEFQEEVSLTAGLRPCITPKEYESFN